jgi:hypothetical protein
MIHGPRTSRSPEASPSQGSSRPSSSTIFMSTPNTARPCVAITAKRSSWLMPRCLALKAAAVPIGLISVMPQAWITCTP